MQIKPWQNPYQAFPDSRKPATPAGVPPTYILLHSPPVAVWFGGNFPYFKRWDKWRGLYLQVLPQFQPRHPRRHIPKLRRKPITWISHVLFRLKSSNAKLSVRLFPFSLSDQWGFLSIFSYFLICDHMLRLWLVWLFLDLCWFM